MYELESAVKIIKQFGFECDINDTYTNVLINGKGKTMLLSKNETIDFARNLIKHNYNNANIEKCYDLIGNLHKFSYIDPTVNTTERLIKIDELLNTIKILKNSLELVEYNLKSIKENI